MDVILVGVVMVGVVVMLALGYAWLDWRDSRPCFEPYSTGDRES